MHEIAHRLLVVAHGTASVQGRATTEALVAEISARRAGTRVDLCFLDVVAPRLPDALDDTPTVLVPLLLSTGFHVQTDIPAAVAGFPATVVARHLGPHPLLIDVLVSRLGALPSGGTVVLLGAGSTRSGATVELSDAADLLGRRLHRDVAVATMGGHLVLRLAALPQPVYVASYLLAPGHFVDAARSAAGADGYVSDPLGVHPALVDLVWVRYDEALGGVR
ncbi:MAG: CbiX/SirB N-terminal domain-containing protein [Jatrophihabitans sp.]